MEIRINVQEGIPHHMGIAAAYLALKQLHGKPEIAGYLLELPPMPVPLLLGMGGGISTEDPCIRLTVMIASQTESTLTIEVIETESN